MVRECVANIVVVDFFLVYLDFRSMEFVCLFVCFYFGLAVA